MKTPTRAFSVRTDRLVDQLNWLRENGYQAVSVDQILAARQPGGKPLPERAVLLTFDDGYRSFLTRVLPILKAYGWPAVLAPVGTWMDTPADRKVDFGGNMQPRDRFLDWNDVREISRSGLVEIAAHTDASHYGALANPQGNTEPAAAVRKYDARNGRYENEAGFEQRMGRDVAAISEKIRRATGKAPRVCLALWRRGRHHAAHRRRTGLSDGADAGRRPQPRGRLMSTPRMLLANDPTIRHFANSVASIETVPRCASRTWTWTTSTTPIRRRPTATWASWCSASWTCRSTPCSCRPTPTRKPTAWCARSTSPNRWLPMRADLFNRVAWQLHNRADVFVYAWMPVLALDLDPSIARVVRWDRNGRGRARAGSRPVPPPVAVRSGRAPAHRRPVRRPGAPCFFDGILFHDDAMLGDFEDAGPAALAAYQKAGLPGSIAAARRSRDDAALDPLQEPPPGRFHRRTGRARRAVRGPRIKTAATCSGAAAQPRQRSLVRAEPGRLPGRLRLDRAHGHALHGKVPAGQELAWLDRIVDAVARRRPDALDRTVFELQAVDWRTGPGRPEPTPVDTATLAGWMQRLQRGARSFGYYPDDFRKTSPGCKASGPPSPKRGSPSDDRPSRPAHPVRGAERALRLRPGADQPGAAGIRVLLPAVHVRPVDGRRLYYWWHWERHWAWARAAKRRPWPAIRWFPSWCPATTRPTTAKTRCWPR